MEPEYENKTDMDVFYLLNILECVMKIMHHFVLVTWNPIKHLIEYF